MQLHKSVKCRIYLSNYISYLCVKFGLNIPNTERNGSGLTNMGPTNGRMHIRTISKQYAIASAVDNMFKTKDLTSCKASQESSILCQFYSIFKKIAHLSFDKKPQ